MKLLPIHIVAGLIAIVAGFVAVYALKGARLHRKSGMIFVYSMLVLSLTGIVIAALKHQPTSVIGGSLAFYLVTTALLTVRRRDHASRSIDAVAMLLVIGVGLFSIKLGLDGLKSPPIRIYLLLAIPALLPLVLMLYWLARVFFTRWHRRRADSLTSSSP